MKKEFLETIKKLYGEDSKIIITDMKLKILYTSCPTLTSKLKEDMFSRSRIAPQDSEGIFPVKERQVLSLWLSGVEYTAVVMPFDRYYVIELLDSVDIMRLDGNTQTAIAEMIEYSELRKAAANIHAALTLTDDNIFRVDPDGPREMYDKASGIILRTSANRSEMNYYICGEPMRLNVDISVLTRELCMYSSLRLAAKGGIKLECDAANDCVAECKGERYAAVLMNLIENAFLYNISEVKRVRVTVESKNGEVRVSVTDNGLGMSLDAIEKAFIPYALCEPGETYGCLGLPLANIFAKTYGGSVSILSHKDDGTTVTLRLPQSSGKVSDCYSPLDDYSGDKFSLPNIYLTRILHGD